MFGPPARMPTRSYGTDPAEAARRIQSARRGWICWYGQHTRRFWAVPHMPGPNRIAEGATPAELLAAMTKVENDYREVAVITRHTGQACAGDPVVTVYGRR